MRKAMLGKRELVERELYDLQSDDLETENIAELPDSQDVVERLQALMAQTVGPARMRESGFRSPYSSSYSYSYS